MKTHFGRTTVSLAMMWVVGCATQGLPPSGRASYVANPQMVGQDGLLQIIANAGYLSYQTPTAPDVPGYRSLGRVRGEACLNEMRLPVELIGSHGQTTSSGAQDLDAVWGNAAVAAAVRDALEGAPENAALFDLTLDLHKTSMLGFFFRRQCLVASGSLGVPWPANASEPVSVPVPVPVENANAPALAPAPVPTKKAPVNLEDEPPLVPAARLAPAKKPPKRINRKKSARPAHHSGHHKGRAHRSH